MNERSWIVLNISLTIIAIILLLNLFGISVPSVGQALDRFDQSVPLCVVQSGEEFTTWDRLDRCCLEARKQLGCKENNRQLEVGEVNVECSAGVVSYHLNSKAYNYCKQLAIW